MKSNQPRHATIHTDKTARGPATKWLIPALYHMVHNLRFHTTHTANTQSPATEWTPVMPCGYPKAHRAAPVQSSHPSETWIPCRRGLINLDMSAPPDQSPLVKTITSPGRPQWLQCPIAAVLNNTRRSCILSHRTVLRRRWGMLVSRSRLRWWHMANRPTLV